MRLPIEDLWPNAESTPVHKPALPAALAPDNDGNVGGSLGGDVKARRVPWVDRGQGSSEPVCH